MSDRRMMARAARQKLAQSLATLQHPHLPADLHMVAEPIAEAMTLLHEVEVASKDAPAELPHTAVTAVRRALSALQLQAARHPAIGQCVEDVAGALNLAHVLSSMPPPASKVPSSSIPPPSRAPEFPDYRLPADGEGARPAGSPRRSYSRPSLEAAALVDPLMAPRGADAQDASYPRGTGPGPEVGAARPAFTREPLTSRTGPNVVSVTQQRAEAAESAPGPRARFVSGPPIPSSALQAAGLANTESALGVEDGRYRPPGAPAPAPASEQTEFEVELTASGDSNFYKGLTGNNVIDQGGIFVSTYRVPRVGQHVLIDFSLPGGYEFRAKGIVSWTREASIEGHPTPGFGARFTEVPLEGVTLITRYVKNREPLLYEP